NPHLLQAEGLGDVDQDGHPQDGEERLVQQEVQGGQGRHLARPALGQPHRPGLQLPGRLRGRALTEWARAVHAFDAYERELWAGRADAYEKGFARVTRHMVGPLLDAAGVMEGTRFLDVGTGPGVVAAEAVRRGAAVSAVDADTGMAEVARRNVPGLDVRIAVLPEVPFGDGEFDAVAGNFVINHVGDPGRALTALRRVLRPGGRLALSCWRMPGSGVLGIVRDAIEEAGVPWPDDIPEPPFMEHGEPAAFRRLVAGAGFREVAVEEVTWEHLV